MARSCDSRTDLERYKQKKRIEIKTYQDTTKLDEVAKDFNRTPPGINQLRLRTNRFGDEEGKS